MLPMDWSSKLEHASSSIVAHDPESVSAEYGQHFPAEKSSSEPLEAPFWRKPTAYKPTPAAAKKNQQAAGV